MNNLKCIFYNIDGKCNEEKLIDVTAWRVVLWIKMVGEAYLGARMSEPSTEGSIGRSRGSW